MIDKTVIWGKVLDSLQTNINKQSFDMWLKDTKPLDFSDDTMKIKVADDVAKRHISDQYSGQIENILESVAGKRMSCEFVINNGFASETEEQPAVKRSERLFTGENQRSVHLNPKYTFENFIIGPNNQLAHAASSAVAHAPATQFNPLFIYGATGLGKTHLMHAVGHHIISEKPFLKVLYVPTEQFINEFINSIMSNTQSSFKIKYRDVDILLIDDIQFIEKKEETQNEFFHTFNNLYENKKQIVISSDRPPKQLSTLTDRLRSRFEWGMITDIQSPNLETREAILRHNAERENLNISDEAINYIARRIKSTIRALEAAISRLKLVSSHFEEQINHNHAKLHLKDLFDDSSNKKVTVTDIMIKVSDIDGISVEELKSKSRHSRLIQPRFKAMYLVRKLTDMTQSDIGKEFGDRDHSTVVNAINKIEEDMRTSSDFKEHIEDLIVELRS
jgi:chromosomal replication initiator protein